MDSTFPLSIHGTYTLKWSDNEALSCQDYTASVMDE